MEELIGKTVRVVYMDMDAEDEYTGKVTKVVGHLVFLTHVSESNLIGHPDQVINTMHMLFKRFEILNN